MSLFVAILGLAFLILIHEAGHFYVARAVGMRPRSSISASRRRWYASAGRGSSTASARSRSGAT